MTVSESIEDALDSYPERYEEDDFRAKSATDRECSRCGTVSERVEPRPHSLAELGDPDNPLLCPDCNSEVSR